MKLTNHPCEQEIKYSMVITIHLAMMKQFQKLYQLRIILMKTLRI